jgi:hypothetical protein
MPSRHGLAEPRHSYARLTGSPRYNTQKSGETIGIFQEILHWVITRRLGHAIGTQYTGQYT